MKIIKLTTLIISLIILFLFGIKNIYIFRNSKNEDEVNKNESLRVLNECFDLKNKSKRSLNKSLELIEYCLKIYGYKNK